MYELAMEIQGTNAENPPLFRSNSFGNCLGRLPTLQFKSRPSSPVLGSLVLDSLVPRARTRPLAQDEAAVAIGAVDLPFAFHIQPNPWMTQRTAPVAGDNLVIGLDGFRRLQRVAHVIGLHRGWAPRTIAGRIG